MPIIARKPGGQRITAGMKTEENVVSLRLLWYKARRHSVYFAGCRKLKLTQLL